MLTSECKTQLQVSKLLLRELFRFGITDVWSPKSKLKLKLGHRDGELQIQKPNFGGGPGGERLRITTLITGVTSTSTSTSI